jgi:GNAT superfamily N-acetyltransferase
MINVVEVKKPKDLKTFVKFPFKLYKDNKYWVPPIINEELETFNEDLNPVFEHAKARFFLAYKNNELVGRVAAIVNWTEVKQQKVLKMRFGWFDFIDDLAVSEALLNKVYEIGNSLNLKYMEGPVGFSNLDKVGVLVSGFDVLGTMITWYNHEYYQKHYEAFGMRKEKGYLESHFPAVNADPKFFVRHSKVIAERFELKTKNFTTSKELMPYVDQMFDLFNESYAKLSSFVPISDRQKAYFKKKYLNFLSPEYIKFVVNKSDELIAFAIVMPSFSKALQKANGKLFPFGFYHLLQAKKHSKDVTFYLIGIRPDYQNKGVTTLLFTDMKKTFDLRGVENCHRTPELEDNHAVHRLWENFDPKIVKRRNTYRKDF